MRIVAWLARALWRNVATKGVWSNLGHGGRRGLMGIAAFAALSILSAVVHLPLARNAAAQTPGAAPAAKTPVPNAPTLGTPPPNSALSGRGELIQRAERALRRGDVAQALDLAEQQLKLQPDSLSAAFVRAVALAELKQTDRALAAFTALTQQFPHVAEPYNNIAVIFAERGDFSAARSALEQSLAANPDSATVHVNLGDVHAALAAQAYERALQLAPRDRGARAKLALARQLRTPNGAPLSPGSAPSGPSAPSLPLNPAPSETPRIGESK